MKPMIPDGEALTRAYYTPDYEQDSIRDLCVYDDGFGGLYLWGHQFGVCGVIRAQTFQDAFEIWEDEYATRADWEEFEQACKDYGINPEQDIPEGFGFRPNGPNAADDTGIYCSDEYEWLIEADADAMRRHAVTVEFEAWESAV